MILMYLGYWNDYLLQLINLIIVNYYYYKYIFTILYDIGALLTLVKLLSKLGGKEDEIIEILDKLKEIDIFRKEYYLDFGKYNYIFIKINLFFFIFIYIKHKLHILISKQ